MRGRQSPLEVILTVEERRTLERWLRSTIMPAGVVRRARAVLLVADSHTLSETGQLVGFSRKIVRRWVSRFVKKRLAGLQDTSGRGRKPVFPPGSRVASRQAGV